MSAPVAAAAQPLWLVVTTVATPEEAEQLAQRLVQQRLAVYAARVHDGVRPASAGRGAA